MEHKNTITWNTGRWDVDVGCAAGHRNERGNATSGDATAGNAKGSRLVCGDERPGRFVRKEDSKAKSILRAILRNAGSHITDVTSVWGIPRGGVRL